MGQAGAHKEPSAGVPGPSGPPRPRSTDPKTRPHRGGLGRSTPVEASQRPARSRRPGAAAWQQLGAALGRGAQPGGGGPETLFRREHCSRARVPPQARARPGAATRLLPPGDPCHPPPTPPAASAHTSGSLPAHHLRRGGRRNAGVGAGREPSLRSVVLTEARPGDRARSRRGGASLLGGGRAPRASTRLRT